MQEIKQLLQWFVFGPGAGYLTYRVMNIPRVVAWIEDLEGTFTNKLGVGKRETKRIVAFLISWALSSTGYGLMLLAGMAETENAVNTIVSLSGISTITSQLAHGRHQLDEGEDK